jgi:hypothetical protein
VRPAWWLEREHGRGVGRSILVGACSNFGGAALDARTLSYLCR